MEEIMKKLIALVVVIWLGTFVIPDLTIADDCPNYPAFLRTRIVKCTDESYAVQTYNEYTRKWATYRDCGLSLFDAKINKSISIEVDKVIDNYRCPPKPKQ